MSQYCQPSDLTLYAINPLALVNVTTLEQTAACIAASETADSHMRGRYQLPLLTWGIDVTMHVAYIAVYLLMSARGYNPSAGADDTIQRRYYESVGFPDRPGSGWFPGIQRQAIHPDVTPSIAPGVDAVHDMPQVASDPPRGWQQFRNGRAVVGGF